ncbi:MAG: hypothetical protein GTN38_02860 [Candidatus Aenigmarchaeota archaeon]|nr:hypothetical protein [Candidatus Aenigmarchaeota archaeon]NIP40584.1 hypothetical protein [Candidatus Aenigmarchaeota archaeon]NIQ18581.1 hypothetical protein [Candidatus Aenigmarchaeota archaeon]
MFKKGLKIFNTYWIMPKVCPVCEGKLIKRGFECKNRIVECEQHPSHLFIREAYL